MYESVRTNKVSTERQEYVVGGSREATRGHESDRPEIRERSDPKFQGERYQAAVRNILGGSGVLRIRRRPGFHRRSVE